MLRAGFRRLAATGGSGQSTATGATASTAAKSTWRSKATSTSSEARAINPQQRTARQAYEDAPELKKWKRTLERLDEESLAKQNIKRHRTIFAFAEDYGKDFVAAYLVFYGCGLGLLTYAFWNRYPDTRPLRAWVVGGVVRYTGLGDEKGWVRSVNQTWDPYVDFAFAFTLNELFEMLRFPILLTMHRIYRRGTLA
eukprot:PhM_4_TR8421/c0_g3_i1/m.55444